MSKRPRDDIDILVETFRLQSWGLGEKHLIYFAISVPC